MSTIVVDTLRFIKKRLAYGWNVILNPAFYNYQGVNIPLAATPELEGIRKRVYLDLYERDEISIIRRLVCRDDIVVEIGVGCGIVSTIIAKHLMDSRNLHCFEANPKLVTTIKAVIGTNGIHSSMTMAAVGCTAGEMELFSSDDFLSSSLIKRSDHKEATTISVIAFDELMGRLQPTFLMIDVEGTEKDLLRGEMPERLRTIVVEFHPHIIGNRAISETVRNLIAQRFDLLLDLSNERVMAFTRMPGSDAIFRRKNVLQESTYV